ncbi:hypothetical protein SDJN03_21836, partial [Cucurbita argyrosperma subsp. sororia]
MNSRWPNPELDAKVDTFQRTPVHLASKHGDMEIVRALLEKNTSACLVYDNNGFIPLHYAVINGQIEIMEELINTRPQSIWTKLNDEVAPSEESRAKSNFQRKMYVNSLT